MEVLAHDTDIESMTDDSRSGVHDAYLSNILLSLEANMSISGVPNAFVMLSKMLVGIAHSAESENSLEAVSANTLWIPGMWAADKCTPLAYKTPIYQLPGH